MKKKLPLEHRCRISEGLKGRSVSAETRAKIGAANRGRKLGPLSKERAEALRLFNVGRKNSPETISKMRAAAIARGISAETRAKINAALVGRVGRRLSIAEREHLRVIHTGMKHSPEACAKIGNAKRGGTHSEATRRKIRLANTGKKRSPESIAKRSGRGSERWGKAPHHGVRVEYRGMTFRSRWEASFARNLDSKGLLWQYEPRRFDLGFCTYTPDFFLPESGAYWEIKGWFTQAAQEKATAFRALFPDESLIVATKPVMEMIGAIPPRAKANQIAQLPN